MPAAMHGGIMLHRIVNKQRVRRLPAERALACERGTALDASPTSDPPCSRMAAAAPARDTAARDAMPPAMPFHNALCSSRYLYLLRAHLEVVGHQRMTLALSVCEPQGPHESNTDHGCGSGWYFRIAPCRMYAAPPSCTSSDALAATAWGKQSTPSSANVYGNDSICAQHCSMAEKIDHEALHAGSYKGDAHPL
jgi:hypothetical protein